APRKRVRYRTSDPWGGNPIEICVVPNTRTWGGGDMGSVSRKPRVCIVEARSLMREALVSLMESHLHHVICSVASSADIDAGSFGEAPPELFILGALPADRVAEAASNIRRLWQDAKIIVLFDEASATDLQKLLASQIDVFIPLFASSRTLI